MTKQRVKQRSFDELWNIYLNGEAFSLADCLRVAKTFDDAVKVYLVALDSSDDEDKGLRSRALHKMIQLASNLSEAKRALAHASKKRVDRKYHFPARFEEARAKVQEFSTTTQ